MNMTLKELIQALTNLQSLAGDDAGTNVESANLKIEAFLQYGPEYGYGYRERSAERRPQMTVLVEPVKADPQPEPMTSCIGVGS